jgi:hypothetical protein
MRLEPGSRLGPYEISGPLGAGGMGEVYRARDTRLGREVAIKVLPEELTNDRDRLARFEREARSSSALNHRNMELIRGESLRDVVARGPVRYVLFARPAGRAADSAVGLPRLRDLQEAAEGIRRGLRELENHETHGFDCGSRSDRRRNGHAHPQERIVVRHVGRDDLGRVITPTLRSDTARSSRRA